MSEKLTKNTVNNYSFATNLPLAGIGIGVWWYVWGLYGFWWGVCYGFFWPIWAGFRLAEYLLRVIA